MKTHRKTHGPKKFVCERCGKSFHRKELLIDHINVHDDAKVQKVNPNNLVKLYTSELFFLFLLVQM